MDNKSVPNSDIKNVQSLLLGENNELITDAVRKDARNIVGEVVTEAIHDRQAKDGSLVKTIAPMMENAISQSIENNKATFVDAMYPVVGSLVRKSVSVFFNSFLEKLNHLIEYSLTLKGIKWRIAAWRQGVSFTQYILKQTFVYRVEDVLLIHKTSGTLLLDVAAEQSECNDPELTSAMLTAINDFMMDSFKHNEEVILDTIKTQELTLVLANSPKAILVAAVSGIPPVELQTHLQQTLDDIHQLYFTELDEFVGDTAPFIKTESHLRSCLLSELNQSEQEKKAPWLAIALLAILMLPLSYLGFQQWKTQQVVNALMAMPTTPGLHLESVETDSGNILLTIMRDPVAVHTKSWLASNELDLANIVIIEKRFASLAPEVIHLKAQKILGNTEFKFHIEGNELRLTGGNSRQLSNQLLSELNSIPGINQLNTAAVRPIRQPQMSENQAATLLFDQLKKELASLTITFDKQSADIASNMLPFVVSAKVHILNLIQLAKQLSVPIGIVISGYSDSTGNQAQNLALSQQRAEQVKLSLVAEGVPNNMLHAVGIGEVPFAQVEFEARAVMFSLISLSPQNQARNAND
ncbi:OmpA family protein [Thalassotalea sp. M1531]|uniref:OmpA family protein n=1 Tax=Thalassotalea algicola TaxID=2716224 RepID=A0A7Y0LCU2_9GAMM|nr:OmpA family protein [Thalassotalea algicola]NMP30760.1 OmpA family protein [Thalassotalea algicola]